jgi:hypothetical protein
MADSSPVQAATPYAAATENLRGAAKWLLAAAAGVAGLLVAGLQLGSLGHLTSGEVLRLVVALIGLAVALAGVALVIWRAGALLSDEWLTLGQLSSEDFRARIKASGTQAGTAAIYTEVETYREELYGSVATTLGDLYRALSETNTAMRSSVGATAEPQAIARAAEVRAAVQNVVDYANYRRTRGKFDSLRCALGSGGTAVVVGLVIFAVASNPPSQPNKAPGSELRPSSSIPAPTTSLKSPSVTTSRPTGAAVPTPTK